MPAEAWVALALGILTIFMTIIGAAWVLSGQTSRTSAILTTLDGRVTEMGKAVDKMEETLQTVATQKEQIQSLRSQMELNTNRTDKTFERVFNMIDQIRGVRPSGSTERRS